MEKRERESLVLLHPTVQLSFKPLFAEAEEGENSEDSDISLTIATVFCTRGQKMETRQFLSVFGRGRNMNDYSRIHSYLEDFEESSQPVFFSTPGPSKMFIDLETERNDKSEILLRCDRFKNPVFRRGKN